MTGRRKRDDGVGERRPGTTPAELSVLASEGAKGGAGAVSDLMQLLKDELVALIRSDSALRALRSSPEFDELVREATTRVLGKVGAKNKLALYERWQGDKETLSFKDWLRIVLKRTVIDLVREQRAQKRLGPAGQAAVDAYNSRVVAIEGRPPFTKRVLFAEVLAVAEQHLDPEQLAVLKLELRGLDASEIAAQLQLTEEKVGLLSRAAEARLRRRLLTTEI